jgi:large subunit ribosomal protein L16
MLSPKRVRHRKQHRPRPLKGMSTGHTKVYVGDFGLMATTPGWITARQIEAARIAMTRAIKRGGKVRITIFPDRSITRKPLETRMGSGKGGPDHWVAAVKPGRVMFELGGVSEELAREAMRKAAHKLPVQTKFISREEA